MEEDLRTLRSLRSHGTGNSPNAGESEKEKAGGCPPAFDAFEN
jgi:hypothetical protein